MSCTVQVLRYMHDIFQLEPKPCRIVLVVLYVKQGAICYGQ